MKDLVDYVNMKFGEKLKHPVRIETLRRWHARGHIEEMTKDGIDAAFAAHKIPPCRGRPRIEETEVEE